ncbi:hypothetical protein Btru_057534 [Bulinus truncatus]|nr:hypothetical protein Btru_057534 [Bulinus truncatus]
MISWTVCCHLIIVCCVLITGSLTERVINIGYNDKVDELEQAFQECGIDHIMILTTSELTFWPVHWILRHSALTGVQLTHYNVGHLTHIHEALADFIWDLYISKQIRNFFIVSSEYNVIMDSVHQVFYDRQRGEAAVLPHKTTFTLIVPSSLDIGDNLPSMVNSTMDNIAVFVVNVKSKQVSQMFTLMYRENRRREWESVHYVYGNNSNVKQTCRIFPNRMYGLNERKLNILTKEWLSHLYKRVDESTGRLQYVGFYVNIVKALSASLNFTVNFVPEPGEDDRIQWSDFSNRVGFGEFDLGATTYIINSVSYFNHSVSFPILWSNVSGVYINRERRAITSPLKLFQIEVYVCLLASLVFTMFLYLLGTFYSNKFQENTEYTFHYRHHCLEHSEQSSNFNLRHINMQRSRLSSVGTQTLNVDKTQTLNVDNTQTLNVDKTQTLNVDKTQTLNVDKTQNLNVDKTQTLNVDKTQTLNVDKSQTLNVVKSEPYFTPLTKKNNGKSEPYFTPLTKKNNDILRPSKHYVNTYFTQCTDTYEGSESVMQSKTVNSSISIPKENLNNTSLCNVNVHLMSVCLEKVSSLGFKFIGSIFCQDSLPEPKILSARFLLWFWCLMLLVLTAIFTGNITANLVDQEESVPFTTFEELLQRTDYKWGLFQESSFFNVMKNARDGTLLRKLYDKMDMFALTDPSVKGTFEDQILKMRTEKYVTFLFSGDLEYLREKANLSNLVVMKDTLMITNLGFIFPKHSTMNGLISEQLLQMSDSGILDYLYKMKNSLSNSVQNNYDTTADIALDFYNMEGLLYCCGFARKRLVTRSIPSDFIKHFHPFCHQVVSLNIFIPSVINGASISVIPVTVNKWCHCLASSLLSSNGVIEHSHACRLHIAVIVNTVNPKSHYTLLFYS